MSKVFSLVPAVIVLLLGYRFASSGGQEETFVIVIVLFILLPLSMIWFPESFAGKTNWFIARLSKDQAYLIACFGWILLLTPLAALLILVFRNF